MSHEEMYARIICLERSLKKANYRIYLLERKKDLAEESKKFFETRAKDEGIVQLDLFQELEAVGG